MRSRPAIASLPKKKMPLLFGVPKYSQHCSTLLTEVCDHNGRERLPIKKVLNFNFYLIFLKSSVITIADAIGNHSPAAFMTPHLINGCHSCFVEDVTLERQFINLKFPSLSEFWLHCFFICVFIKICCQKTAQKWPFDTTCILWKKMRTKLQPIHF